MQHVPSAVLFYYYKDKLKIHSNKPIVTAVFKTYLLCALMFYHSIQCTYFSNLLCRFSVFIIHPNQHCSLYAHVLAILDIYCNFRNISTY